MKVVSIVTSFPRNKEDVLIPWIIRLIKLLQIKGVNTEIFTSSYSGRKNEVSEGISVRRFRYFCKKLEKLSHDMSVPEKLKSNPAYFLILPFFMLFGMIAAYRFGKKNDIDIIHVHFPFPLALFGIAMKFAAKKPMIVSCHGSEVNMAKRNNVFRSIFKWMLKRSDIITVNSTFMRNELTKIIGDRDIEIIPMGSGIGDIAQKEKVIRGEGRKRNILYVGRLIEWKGVEFFIKASQLLDPEEYEFHIVGDGPERDRLEKMAENKDQEASVSTLFHGYLKGTALRNMYKNADVFILPSIVDADGYTEGLGTVLLEAISYGVPVIGTNVGGIPDIVKDNETGLLVPQKDPQAIADAIETISGRSDLRKELTRAAINHVSGHFSWERISEKFYNLYKKMSD